MPTARATYTAAPINSATGSLSACIANPIGTVNTLDGIAVTATKAYIVDINGENLSTCAVSSIDGSLSACAQQTLIGTNPAGGNTPNSSPRSASVYGGNLYIGTKAGVLILPIAGDGTVTVDYPCSLTIRDLVHRSNTASVQTPVTGFAFNNGYAYVSGYGSGGRHRDLHDRSVRPIGQLPDQPELDRILRRGCGPLTPELRRSQAKPCWRSWSRLRLAAFPIWIAGNIRRWPREQLSRAWIWIDRCPTPIGSFPAACWPANIRWATTMRMRVHGLPDLTRRASTTSSTSPRSTK